jgi:hypothetical protein
MGISWDKCIVLSSVLALCTVVGAQQESQHIVVDDGDLIFETHYRPPNRERLSAPDFRPADLPLFDEMLMLEAGQQLFVEARLQAYLHAFEALLERMMPPPSGGPDEIVASTLDVALEGQSIKDLLNDVIGDEAGLIDMESDGAISVSIVVTADGAPHMAMGTTGGDAMPESPAPEDGSVGLEVGGMAPAGADGNVTTEAEVTIGIQTSDDEQLSPEVQEQLQQRVAEMAARIETQIQENIEAGTFDLQDGMNPMDRVATQQEQARESNAQAAALIREKANLRRDFILDVHAQLTPEQVDIWPALERYLLRRDTLSWGMLDGESIDLVRLVSQLSLQETQLEAVADALAAYELAMHRALLKRNRNLETADIKINEALWQEKPEAAMKIVEEGTKLRVGVRDVNRQYVNTIAQNLAAVDASNLQYEALNRSFPRVFRLHPGRRAFAVAYSIEDLDADVLLAITELQTLYRRELELVNEQLMEAIVRYQPDQEIQTVRRLLSPPDVHGDLNGQAVGSIHPRIAMAFVKRSRLDQRYLRRLRTMLTVEQAEQLPEIRTSRGSKSQTIWIQEKMLGD